MGGTARAAAAAVLAVVALAAASCSIDLDDAAPGADRLRPSTSTSTDGPTTDGATTTVGPTGTDGSTTTTTRVGQTDGGDGGSDRGSGGGGGGGGTTTIPRRVTSTGGTDGPGTTVLRAVQLSADPILLTVEPLEVGAFLGGPRALLTADGGPVVGVPILFSTAGNPQVCIGTTNRSGVASCTSSTATTDLLTALTYTAAFAADPDRGLAGATATGPILK